MFSLAKPVLTLLVQCYYQRAVKITIHSERNRLYIETGLKGFFYRIGRHKKKPKGYIFLNAIFKTHPVHFLPPIRIPSHIHTNTHNCPVNL